MRYPLAHVTYGAEEIDAVVEALKTGQTTCGPRVREFEQAFAHYVGREDAVMVNSGSSADLLVAFGLGPQQGKRDEILVPAVTWPTQVWSCLLAGYLVRLVDVDPETLQFDWSDLCAKIGPRTRAVFPVHVLGTVGDMAALKALADQHGAVVLEDCCEALGSRYQGQHVGTFGQAAAFSFFFSHLITTMEGGMVACDAADAREYRLRRSHGWEPTLDYKFWFPTWGLNLRPTELQGAFGCVQLGRADIFREAREGNAWRLEHEFGTVLRGSYFQSIRVLPECHPAWHAFPVMVAPEAPFTKAQLCLYLDERGVENRPIIAGNLARQPAVQDDPRIVTGPLPGADVVHERGFYIGLASYEDDAGTGYVGEVVADFLKSQ